MVTGMVVMVLVCHFVLVWNGDLHLMVVELVVVLVLFVVRIVALVVVVGLQYLKIVEVVLLRYLILVVEVDNYSYYGQLDDICYIFFFCSHLYSFRCHSSKLSIFQPYFFSLVFLAIFF